MLSFGNRRIFLCAGRVDMRKGFSGLTGLVLSDFHQDPRGGDAFVFVGRSGRMLKVLVWEGDGFWCCAKKLVRGTFVTPVVRGVSGSLLAVELRVSDWQLLLEGVLVQKMRYVPRLGR